VILYLDTSSLVKLYLDEAHSDLMTEWAKGIGSVATSRVAYPEALSAFSRRWNRGDLTSEQWGLACESLAREWPTFFLIPLNELRAGAFVTEHLLRGFDAVHLAAACDLADRFPAEDIVFSSFDANLLEAARASGLLILHPVIRDGLVMDSSGFPWALAHER
jgi:predicted nucleic acid-binding protein